MEDIFIRTKKRCWLKKYIPIALIAEDKEFEEFVEGSFLRVHKVHL